MQETIKQIEEKIKSIILSRDWIQTISFYANREYPGSVFIHTEKSICHFHKISDVAPWIRRQDILKRRF